jgi:hypothetical protein
VRLLVWCVALLLVTQGVSAAQGEAVITIENAYQLAETARWRSEGNIVLSVAFEPDGRYLTAITSLGNARNGEVNFFDPQTLNDMNITSDPLLATSMTFSDDGSLFATGSADGVIKIFDTESFNLITELIGEKDTILNISISPLNTYVAVTHGAGEVPVNGDSTFQVFNIATGEEVLAAPNVNAEGQRIYGLSVTFDDPEQHLIVATSDETVRSYNLQSQETRDIGTEFSRSSRDLIYQNDALIYLTDKMLRFVQTDGQLQDIAIEVLENQFGLLSFALHPTEELVAISSDLSERVGYGRDGILRLLDLEQNTTLTTIRQSGEDGSIFLDLAFSPDGTLLASANLDGTVQLWGIPS